jgi:membrane protein DedA with SNARE-associated domain
MMMEQTILDIIDRFGYVGVCFLVALENIFPPIPSEIILTFSGFMTTFSTMRLGGVIAAATIGAIIGACILYAVGRLVNADRLERLFASPVGRMLHVRREDVKRAERWFLRHSSSAVFLCRFVPIVRSLISLPAGIARMRLKLFLVLTALGTLIWNTVLVLLGRMAGDAWQNIVGYIDVYATLVAGGLTLAAFLIGVFFLKRRFWNQRRRREDGRL